MSRVYKAYIDINNDGDFVDANEDISAYLVNADWSYGASFPSVIPGSNIAGSCTLTVLNGSGFFSKLNAASPFYGLNVSGLPLKLAMNVDGGGEVTMWQGEIKAITERPGQVKLASKANIYAVGILDRINKKEIAIAMATSLTTGTAMGNICDEIGIGAGSRTLDTGQTTLTRFWTDKVSALYAMRHLEMTETGLIREGKDGKFIFEDRAHRAGHSVSATYDDTGGSLGFSTLDIQLSTDSVYNIIQADAHTWDVTADMVLWEYYGDPISLAASASITLWSNCPNPTSPLGFIVVDSWSTVTLSANTAADGSGSDISGDIAVVQTKFAATQKLVITNNNAATAYLLLIQANGSAVIESAVTTVTSEDATSQTAYGKRTLTCPSRFIASTGEAQSWCDHILAMAKDEPKIITITVPGHKDSTHATECQSRSVSDKIHIDSTNHYLNTDCFIEHIAHRVSAEGEHYMTLKCLAYTQDSWGSSNDPYTAKTKAGWELLDYQIPSAPQNLGITIDGGHIVLSWDDPADGSNTIDEVSIRWATDSGFTAGVGILIGLGKINSYKTFLPNRNYYFRVACHNRTILASNTTTDALIDAAGGDGTYGWGPFCTAVQSGASGTIKSPDLSGTAIAQYGVYDESFEDGSDGERKWNDEYIYYPKAYPSNGIKGGLVLHSVGMLQSCGTEYIPYDVSYLYRMSVRWRRTWSPQTTLQNAYMGVRCYDKDKVATTPGYVWLHSVDMYIDYTVDTWYAVSKWFKGTGSGGAGDTPTDPILLNSNTAYIRPLYILNYYNSTTNEAEIDSITIQAFDPDGQKRIYLAANSSGQINTNMVIEGSITAGAVTAGKISVTNLSAINADIGTITAGTVTGTTIRTAASGQRIELSGTSMKIYNSGGSVIASITDAGVWTFNEGAITTDRGDPSGWDMDNTMTQDSAWHDWDLSSIVPAGMRTVLLHVRATPTSGTGAISMQFRKKGNSNAYNVASITANKGDAVICSDIFVTMDSSRVIEYISTSSSWDYVYICVGAYMQ